MLPSAASPADGDDDGALLAALVEGDASCIVRSADGETMALALALALALDAELHVDTDELLSVLPVVAADPDPPPAGEGRYARARRDRATGDEPIGAEEPSVRWAVLVLVAALGLGMVVLVGGGGPIGVMAPAVSLAWVALLHRRSRRGLTQPSEANALAVDAGQPVEGATTERAVDIERAVDEGLARQEAADDGWSPPEQVEPSASESLEAAPRPTPVAHVVADVDGALGDHHLASLERELGGRVVVVGPA